MNKSELVQKLAGQHKDLSFKDTDLSVTIILEAISNTLSNGGRAEIRGFGSFTLNLRPPRIGRNPKSGQSVQVPAKHVPHFKAGKELRERLEHS